MPNREQQLWKDIQDIIGPATFWPRRIRRLFWTRNIKHWDRIICCVFVFVNGLHPELFFEWVYLKNMCRDYSAVRQIRYLLTTFENEPKKYNWWAWNVTRRQRETIGGDIVLY
jgi:hypothetical protein